MQVLSQQPLPSDASLAECLLRHGFLPATAQRLAPMLLRYARGELPELEGRVGHLLFICWLIDHGHLSDGLETPGATRLPAVFAAVSAAAVNGGIHQEREAA